MIRAAWFAVNAALATLFFGTIVFAAAILGIRGGVYDRVARRWSATLLRASACRIRCTGLDRVDWSRSGIVVCNHLGSFDVLALAVAIPVP